MGNRVRVFLLKRHEDPGGVSGTGFIAEGMEFSTGKCVLAWRTEYKSIAIYESIDDLMAIHGHDGLTEIRFMDMSES